MKVNVLLIDDEILTLQYLEKMIAWEAEGFHLVGLASTYFAALEIMQKHNPEIIISDIRMPGMSGMELGAALREINPACKIIYLTAYSDFESAQRAVQLKAFDFILKHQLEPEKLIDVLKRARDELKEDNHMNRIVVLQELNNLFHGLSVAGDELNNLFEKGNAVITLSVRQDWSYFTQKTEPSSAMSMLNATDRGILADAFQAKEIGFFAYEKMTVYAFEAAARMPNSQSDYASALPQIERIFSQRTESAFIAFSATLESLRSDISQTKYMLGLDYVTGSRVYTVNPSSISVCNESLRETELKEILFDDTAHSDRFRSFLQHLLSVLYSGEELWTGWKTLLFSMWNLLLKEAEEYGIADSYEGQYPSTGIRQAIDSICAFREMLLGLASGDTKNKRRMELAIQYIDEHFQQDISCQDIASAIGISEGHLRLIANQESGKSLLQLIRERRMQEAKKLLGSGKYKVHQVAEKCGYHSPQYFWRDFRNHAGVSPAEYLNGRRKP